MTSWLFAAAVALAPGCAAAPRAAAPVIAETPRAVTSAVRGLIEQWRQAYEVRSVDALAPIYAHDPDVVVVQEGEPVVGWSSVGAMLQNRLATATAIRVRLKDVEVSQIAPTVAVAVATMTREIQAGAVTTDDAGTLSLVLRRSPSAEPAVASSPPWRIVAEHYSYKPGTR